MPEVCRSRRAIAEYDVQRSLQMGTSRSSIASPGLVAPSRSASPLRGDSESARNPGLAVERAARFICLFVKALAEGKTYGLQTARTDKAAFKRKEGTRNLSCPGR
jgi:hypothetical protein